MYNPYLPRQEREFLPDEPKTLPHMGGALETLRDIFGKIHLERLDSGDLLLLLVALLLWREGEEREFAAALGFILLLELFGDSPL